MNVFSASSLILFSPRSRVRSLTRPLTSSGTAARLLLFNARSWRSGVAARRPGGRAPSSLWSREREVNDVRRLRTSLGRPASWLPERRRMWRLTRESRLLWWRLEILLC